MQIYCNRILIHSQKLHWWLRFRVKYFAKIWKWGLCFEISLVLKSTLIYLFISTLREESPYSEFFRSVFSRIRTEYGEILNISLYLIWIWENAEQKNSKYGNFSRIAEFSHSWCQDIVPWHSIKEFQFVLSLLQKAALISL